MLACAFGNKGVWAYQRNTLSILIEINGTTGSQSTKLVVEMDDLLYPFYFFMPLKLREI